MIWFIAMDSSHWGRGKTKAVAQKQLKKAGGSLRTHIVYKFDEPEGKDKPYVDGMGNTVSYGQREQVSKVKNYKEIA